jgi:hypothetical protein
MSGRTLDVTDRPTDRDCRLLLDLFFETASTVVVVCTKAKVESAQE